MKKEANLVIYLSVPCVDFPLPANVNVPPSVVYVFEFMAVGQWNSFYVGATRRFPGRMHDYERAAFAAATDFQVGKAVQFLQQHGYPVRVRYEEVNKDARARRERALIRQKLIEGARLLNCFPSYDYRNANEQDEETAVHQFCHTMINFAQR